MTEKEHNPHVIREAVASFATRTALRSAAAGLLAAGFAPADLSVLASHDSLEVAGNVAGYPGGPSGNLLAGLTDEVVFLEPLTIAGLSFLSAGPLALGLAAVASAGLGTAAIKEVLDRFAANRHAAEFASALQAGAVLLWVRTDRPELEATALRTLGDTGGRYVHIHTRTVPGAGAKS
ncbi:MAG: hypothetical protein ACREFQ_19500 [Stellaceae bacterium]